MNATRSLADSQLVEFRIGLSLNDCGGQQCAKIKSLRSFGVAHSQFTAGGVRFFAGHPTLTECSIAERASNRVTERALGPMAEFPRLVRIGCKECYVTCDGGFPLLAPLKGHKRPRGPKTCVRFVPSVLSVPPSLFKRDHAR